MSNLAFLLVPLGASVVGSVLLWARHRKPTSVESGIDQFHRGLQALAPGGGIEPNAGRKRRRRAL